MSTTTTIRVECPVCQGGEGEAVAVIASTPGYRENGVDDVYGLTMYCTCIDSPFVNADALKAALLEQARKRAEDA